MSEYAVAHLDEIDELTDGREPWRPVRHHFGITSFGVTAWTGRDVGDRIINEHDESEDHDQQEELYLVQQGRARFELDGENVDAPAGTFVFVRPSVRRTAFAEEPNTTVVVVGGRPGHASRAAGRCGRRSACSTRRASTRRSRTAPPPCSQTTRRTA